MILYSLRLWLFLVSLFFFYFLANPALALEPGTILYRTSSDGKMYGYSSKELIKEKNGIISNIYSGHTAIYIGQEDGVDYVVEALGSGIVKTPAHYFINENNDEGLVAAKIPKAATSWQRAKAVAIAKYLASIDLAYDFNFSAQKGPWSGDWTCVGLSEKIYESANASNPERLGSLEYEPSYYAVDITPDGYDGDSIYNEKGDCFSTRREFSKIARRVTTILPLPEIIGYNAGIEYKGGRYLFLPYTQAAQPTLADVPVDIDLSSAFPEEAVRGKVNNLALVLRWSLIDNPVSSVKNITTKIESGLKSLFAGQKREDELVWAETSGDDKKEINGIVNEVAEKISQFSVVKNPDLEPSSSAPVVKDSGSSVTKTIPAPSSSSLSSPAKIEDDIFSAARPLVNSESTSSSSPVSSPVVNSAVKKNLAIWSPVAAKLSTTTEQSQVELKPVEQVESEKAEEATLTLVLSRLHTNGDDDWLEIWNYGEQDLDLASRKIRLEKSRTALDPGIILRFDSPSDASFPGGTLIRAGEPYRVVRDDASAELKAAADAIASRADFTFSDNAYTIYLAAGAVSSPDDADIIDFLGYGEAKYYEGSAPAPALTAGYLLRRKAKANTTLADILNGGNQASWPPVYDNDNNASDWLLWPLGGSLPEEENEEEEEEENNNESESNEEEEEGNNISDEETPFSVLPGIDSPGLWRLWSFSDCSGSTTLEMVSEQVNKSLSLNGSWAIGRWGCGYILPTAEMGLVTADLEPALSGENFSLAFQFQGDGDYANSHFAFNNQAENISLRFELGAGRMAFFGFPGLAGQYQIPNYMDGVWHHGALVWNALGEYWAFYVDAEELFRVDFSGFAPGFDSLSLGAFAGKFIIDDLALWNRALSLVELQALASATLPLGPQKSRAPIPELSLRHAWNFDEASGSIAEDSVGNIDWELPEGALVYSGVSGKALNFPPSGTYYSLNIPTLKTNNFSTSWWWQNQATSPYSGRLHLDLNDGDQRLAGLVLDTRQQRLLYNDKSELWADNHEVFPDDNAWHHFALVYDDYDYLWQLFVDGVLKLEARRLPLLAGGEISRINFSSSSDNYKLDNFKVWQGRLDAAKVWSEYQAERAD